ncbi:hypothetical protein J4443_04320 [Candidatus Woesearchaeota archaeon]|nr:hypothetical protein [Candidatus Woesearchaeota archaeon]
MGIFGMLRFWRKKDENEEEERGYEEGAGEIRTEVPPWSRGYDDRFQQRQDRFSGAGGEWGQPQQPQQSQQQSSGSHEIILAKLDLINAKLDSLNQRLANLERYASEDDREKSRSRW